VAGAGQARVRHETFDFDRDLGMMDAWGRLADAKDADLSGSAIVAASC
jgi:hypothetical protein